MTITCLCMYHGRNWVLPEAVRAFTQQDFAGDARLLIVNDCEAQELFCTVPRVEVINIADIPDMSEKQNKCVAMCDTEWVCLWDDDDISLPWRLSLLTRHVNKNPHAWAVCSSRAWYCEDSTILNVAANCFAGTAFFRRDYYIEAGGAVLNQPPDRSAWYAMMRGGRATDVAHAREEIPYIYRWHGTGVHDSGIKSEFNKVRHHMFHEAVLADRRFRPGMVRIQPCWNRNYLADVQQAIKKGVPTL
jgi:hypothetical protein